MFWSVFSEKTGLNQDHISTQPSEKAIRNHARLDLAQEKLQRQVINSQHIIVIKLDVVITYGDVINGYCAFAF